MRLVQERGRGVGERGGRRLGAAGRRPPRRRRRPPARRTAAARARRGASGVPGGFAGERRHTARSTRAGRDMEHAADGGRGRWSCPPPTGAHPRIAGQLVAQPPRWAPPALAPRLDAIATAPGRRIVVVVDGAARARRGGRLGGLEGQVGRVASSSSRGPRRGAWPARTRSRRRGRASVVVVAAVDAPPDGHASSRHESRGCGAAVRRASISGGASDAGHARARRGRTRSRGARRRRRAGAGTADARGLGRGHPAGGLRRGAPRPTRPARRAASSGAASASGRDLRLDAQPLSA